MAGGANDRSTLRWFGPNTPSIGQTSVAFGLRFLARGFLFGARAPAFRRFGFRRCRPRHPGLRVVAFPSFPVRCFPRSAHPLSDPSRAGLPFSGPPQSAPPLSGSPQSAQRESGPWLGAALRSPVLRPGQKIPLRPGVRTAVGWTTRARTPDPRISVSRSPCPRSQSPWSPCFGSSRPFAIRSLPTPPFGLRSFAGAVFRSPAFPGGLESPETGWSVRPKAQIKSTTRIRTRDLQMSRPTP